MEFRSHGINKSLTNSAQRKKEPTGRKNKPAGREKRTAEYSGRLCWRYSHSLLVNRSHCLGYTIDQIVYRQGYQYINVSPTTIVAPLVVGVVKSPANNSLGLASLEFLPPFSLR